MTSTIATYASAWQTGRPLYEKDSTGTERSVEGRLIFRDDSLPAAGKKIHIYARDFFNFDHFLGVRETDNDGNFSINYNWTASRFARNLRIVMKVVEEKLPFSAGGLKKDVVIESIIRKISLSKPISALGTVLLTKRDTTGDLTVVAPPLPSHTQSPRYFIKFAKAVAWEAPKRVAAALLPTPLVQRLYDSFGPSYPKRSPTPEHLIEELLNHVTAVTPSSINGQVTWEANWDNLDFEQDNTLPNVRVIANKNTNALILDSIQITYRDENKATTVTPFDKNFPWAVYVARSTFALKGEAEFHLAEGHILPGVIAKEFFKYMPTENPLYKVLQPHLAQLDFINWLGSKGVIFGSGSVLDLSALTAKSVAEVIIKSVQTKASWKSYKPQEPLADNHYLAKGEALHFKILVAFFNDYIQKNHEKIIKDWQAITNWSNEISKQLATFEPLEQDSLATFCAWLVSKTTFLHWAAHSRQQLLTDINQASLAPQRKAKNKDGSLAPFGNTPSSSASQQLFVARTLLNFDGDSLFDNPYGDINKDLIKALDEHLNEYEGYHDIKKMFPTTYI